MLHLFYSSLLVMIQVRALISSPSVVIVGAGASGIAAATKLLENSITNITILEAEDRIGGRIKSVEFGEGFVDVGAEYCHGEEGNIVYQMVKNLDVLEHTHVVNAETNKLYYSDGFIIESELALDLDNVIGNYAREVNKTTGLNLGEAFLLHYNTTILEKYSYDKKKLKIATDAIKFAQDLILMHESAFSWTTPAAGSHYHICDGDSVLTWKTRGYHMILDILMKSYPDPSQKLPINDKILLNRTVTKITWNASEVTVKTSDDRKFVADYVIFTPSIGVLKHTKDSIFEPQLPKRKLEAINAIGFGAIIKIILHFPQKWWKDDDKAFFFIWSHQDLVNINKEHVLGPTKDGIPWVSQIVALVKVPSNPNVLIAWVSGELIPQIEETSEEIILNGCLYTIRKFLGRDYNVTAADKIIRSQWYSNPHFRGTYSYEQAEYFKKDVFYQTQLAEPLDNGEGRPVVFFAGEATHPSLFSTVHGAIESGRREAERIISSSRK